MWARIWGIEKATKYLNDGLKLERDQGNRRKIARCHHLIGLAMEAQARLSKRAGNTQSACKRFHEALDHLEKAQELYEEVGADRRLYNRMRDLMRVRKAWDECQSSL